MTSEQPARVLVVADDEQTVNAIREALGTDGLLVEANHLDAAFATLQKRPFDHVLLLPDVTREEFNVLARFREVSPRAQIVLLDNVSRDTVARALPSLLKPLRPDGSTGGDGAADVPGGRPGDRSSGPDVFTASAGAVEPQADVRRSREALRFVAGLSRVLRPSLGEDGVVGALGPIVVPTVADWCVLDLVEGTGSREGRRLRRVLVFPEPKDGVLARLLHGAVPDRAPLGLADRAERVGSDCCWSRDGTSDLGELLGDSRFASALLALDPVSVGRVPVAGTEGLIGVMTVVRGPSGRPIDALDQEVLSAIAGQLSVALEHARRVGAERVARSQAERATERMQRVQMVTASLSQAILPERVAEVVVTQGIGALEASAGLVMRLSEEGTSLRLLRAVGYDLDALAAYQNLTLDAPFPLADAVRRKDAVWIESPQDWARSYPLGPLSRTAVLGEAWAAIPLLVNDQAIGVLGLSFSRSRHFDDDERGFVSLLADQCAQALLRAAYYEGEWDAQRRLAVLADASKAFATFSLDLPVVLETITRGVAEELGGGLRYLLPLSRRVSVRRLWRVPPGRSGPDPAAGSAVGAPATGRRRVGGKGAAFRDAPVGAGSRPGARSGVAVPGFLGTAGRAGDHRSRCRPAAGLGAHPRSARGVARSEGARLHASRRGAARGSGRPRGSGDRQRPTLQGRSDRDSGTR